MIEQFDLFEKHKTNNSKQQIIHGDCLDIMASMENDSIDFCVTDSPYGLNFMGKKWDAEIPNILIWKQLLRILKPGSILAAFGGSRTHHHLMIALEQTGFEIRDCIMWLYGSGFPKSHNNFGLSGYGTSLKPAFEIIVLAMKPLDGTYAKNVERWGLGGINIDKCRIIPTAEDAKKMERCNTRGSGRFKSDKFGSCGKDGFGNKSQPYNSTQGRWPANIILNEESAALLDQQSGFSKSGKNGWNPTDNNSGMFANKKRIPYQGHNDSGGASRFFYCAKASPRERNKGLDCYLTVKYTQDILRGTLCQEENTVAVQLLKKVILDSDLMNLNIEESGENILAQFHKDFSSIIKTKIKQIIESKILNWLTLLLTKDYILDANSLQENGGSLAVNVMSLKMWILAITNDNQELALGASNVALKMLQLISKEENWKKGSSTHPTVKPIALMKYIIKLLAPPNNPTLIDPFLGSGTTLLACKELQINAIGIEKELEYVNIAKQRLESW